MLLDSIMWKLNAQIKWKIIGIFFYSFYAMQIYQVQNIAQTSGVTGNDSGDLRQDSNVNEGSLGPCMPWSGPFIRFFSKL